VYRYYKVHNEFEKAQRVIRDLYYYFLEHGLMERNGVSWGFKAKKEVWANEKVAHRMVCDFIAGMTDRYALSLYEHIFLPKPWNAR
jgi:dGTPase